MQNIKKYWLISSKPEPALKTNYVHKGKGINFYSDIPVFEKISSGKKIIVMINGYVLPKSEYMNRFENLEQCELIFYLYCNYRKNLLNYIKGNFVIIIISEDEFLLFNDYLGLSKFFYNINGENFKITNNYSFISNSFEKLIDKDAIINFTLFQHFTGGSSFYKHICYSSEAAMIEYYGSLKILNYWSPEELINLHRDDIALKEFSAKFNDIVNNYVVYLKPNGISMTLTGGRDTRTILSSLLNKNILPNTFTFGNPSSSDVIISGKISDKLSLKFDNYYLNADSLSYNNLVEEIFEFDNPLIHLHRAHRLDAYRQDYDKYRNEMLFVGAMGGDYIKGAHLDDYILTRFVRMWYFEDMKNNNSILSFLKDNYIKENLINVYEITEALNNSEFWDSNRKKMEFKFVNNLVGILHDYQDIFLAGNIYKYCIVPFMDIDFLYLLFSTKFSMFNNLYVTGNPFLMLKGSELQCGIINYLFPELSEVPFAAGYTPKDVLGNKYKYILKRIYLQKMKKTNSVQNFAYKEWMIDFIKANFKYIEIMSDIYNTEKMKNDIEKNNHKTTEGYWHKFTNPIMFGKMREKY